MTSTKRLFISVIYPATKLGGNEDMCLTPIWYIKPLLHQPNGNAAITTYLSVPETSGKYDLEKCKTAYFFYIPVSRQ